MPTVGDVLISALAPESVLLDLAAPDAKSVIGALASCLAGRVPGADADELARGLREREALGSTAIGGGVALPHCRSSQLESPIVAVACVPSGVAFGAADGVPVRLFVAVAAPDGSPGDHLRVLAQVARRLRQPDSTPRLLGAETAEEVVAWLSGRSGDAKAPP